MIGVWPRYIEPKWLSTTYLKHYVPGLKHSLRVVQLSDLHYSHDFSDSFLNKILKRTNELNPDMIVLTGDLLTLGRLENRKKLSHFLKTLKAPLGIFMVLGNHDYKNYIGINEQGDYDLIDNHQAPLSKGLQLLFKKIKLSKKVSKAASQVIPHPELIELLKECSIQLLENDTIQIADLINLVGVSEYMSGQIDLKKTYKKYNHQLPGIILAHNPDAFPLLENQPGDIVLSGHTHGGQVNLPWFWKRFTVIENPHYKSGLFKKNGKTLYVSRGLGAVMKFRWNATPELICIDLEKEAR